MICVKPNTNAKRFLEGQPGFALCEDSPIDVISVYHTHRMHTIRGLAMIITFNRVWGSTQMVTKRNKVFYLSFLPNIQDQLMGFDI